MKHNKHDDIHGWLVVDKPCGMGSTEAVSLTRRLLNANKNGHCGTLDPFASGLLPIAFGEACKLIPLISDSRKEYEFVIQWGAATASGDPETEVIERSDYLPTEKEIQDILPRFCGKIRQTPPIYSAVKINGQRAYDLARAGKTAEMPEREVEIFKLELTEVVSKEQARLRVECSKGTYVRSLGRDLARALGTCGHLRALRRTRVGIFDLEDKILLENIKKIGYGEELLKKLLPVETCLRDIADIAVSEADAAKLKQGQSLSPRHYDLQNLLGQTVAATCQGQLAALVRIEERRIAPVRVFNFNQPVLRP